jgi:hypothetical protein
LSAADTSPVSVDFTTADGAALAGSDYTATGGTLTFVPGVTSKTIRVSLLDDAAPESAETFTVNLSNAIGATITAGTGAATILDNDSTKFYVVDDASPDRTYRYGLPGNALANSTLGSGDTAPRGATSTAAGTKVWVADANNSVYVYSSSGALLGSWVASGLPKNAAVEGIATNGTDIWIVANSPSKDKMFKYTGAASRLSGTQSVASSFGLNSADANPKGIVTDGTSLWLVDDASSTDKVFKYTLTGSLLGSWTIDAANTHPTGLTINPGNVSDIWIVDNGTDKVYQYSAAAGRASGSQNAAATFALAAGNTNPQDIADPPAPDLTFTASHDSIVQIHPAVVRSLPITLATPSVQTPSLHPGFVAWLAQAQPVALTRGGGLFQAVTQATVISLAPVTPDAVPSRRVAPETGLRPTETSIPHHQIVDLVFSDSSLGSIDLELLSRDVAPGS